MEAHPNAAVTTELNRQWIDEQWEKRSKCDQCLTPVDPLAWDAVKILPCLHILCNDVCVEKNKSEEDEGIGCPKCFHIVGVSEMNECLEFGLAIHRNERRLLCTHCTQGKRAYFFCKDCDDPMCDGCNGGHLFLRRSASHVVVPITSDFKFPEAMESVKCDDHLKVEAVKYCKTCENALCAQCVGDQTHVKHEVLAMDAYLDGLWKKVQEMTHKIKEFVPKTETIESEIKNQQTILLDYKNSEPFKRTKRNLKRIIELLIRAEIKVRGELKAAQQKKYGTWDKKIHFLRAVKLKTAHFVENLGDGPKLANHDLMANRKIIQKRLEKMNTDVMVCERLPIDDESDDEDCSSNIVGVEPMEVQSCGNKKKSVAAKKSEEPGPSTSRAVRNQCSRLISKYVNPTEFSEEEWELIATAEDLPDGSDDDESDSEDDEDEPGQGKMVSIPLGAVSGTPVKNAFDSSKVMDKSVVANGVSVQTLGHLELIPDNKEQIDKTTVIVKNCEQAMDLKETPDFETKKTSVKMMNGESKGNNPDSGVLNRNQDTKNSTEDIGNASKKLNEQINIAGIGVKFEIPLKDVVGTSDPEDSSKVPTVKLTENGVKKNESGGGGSTVEMNGNGGGLEGDFLAPPSKPAKPEKTITSDVSKNGDLASSSQVQVKAAIIPKKRPVSEIVVENLPVKKVIRSRCSLGAVQPVKKSVAEPSSGYKRKVVESDSEDTDEMESAKDVDSGDRNKRSLRIRDRKKAAVPPPPPPPPPPTPPPNKSRRSSTSGRGRGPGRPAKVRDPIVTTKEVESTKPKVDVSPVPGEVESAAPTNPTCTAPPLVATIAPIKRTSTAPLKLTSIEPPQVATTAPAKLTNTEPPQVASTAPAQVATTAPAQVASTAAAEVTSTLTVKPERAIPIEGECSVCLVTGQGEMLICDSCLLIYHNTCHLPAMAAVSPDEWYCIVCRDMGGLEKPSPAATTDLEIEKARMLEVPSPLPRADFLRACRFLAVMLHYTRCQAMLRHVGSRNKMQGEEEFLNFDMIRMRLTLATPTPYANATDIIKDIETMIRQSRNFFTTKNNAHGIDTVEAVQKIFLDTMHTYYPKWKQILEPETGILHFEVSN